MSVSGIRGIVGTTLTPAVALQVGIAFGTLLQGGTVVVGGDTRTSFDMLSSATTSGLTSVGCAVIHVGYVTTPTLQHAIRSHQAAGGIIITASHNPIEWNGLKLMNHEGAFLSGSDYEHFMTLYQSSSFFFSTYHTVGSVSYDTTAIDTHLDVIFSKLDVSSILNANLRVLCDANHGAAAVANPKLFQRLGIPCDLLHSEPTGRFAHNPEPLEKNLSSFLSKMKEGDYDIGFAQDADADRLVIVDETGRFIGEDYSLAYCIDYILSQSPTQNPAVVVNLSTSQVISDLCKKHGATLYQTKIGESYVTQGLKEQSALVGGEGNGGVIYPSVGWGRDSLTGIVIALKHLVESKQTVSQTVSLYPSYTMIRHQFSLNSRLEINPLLEKLKNHYKALPQDHQDGVKVMFPDGWVHVRPSNTEPIARVYIEKPSLESATALLKEVESL